MYQHCAVDQRSRNRGFHTMAPQRILCLHGKGGSKERFEQTARECIGLHDDADDVEFVAVDAPHQNSQGQQCWWLPIPSDARSYSADGYTGVAESVAALQKASGGVPFDGVVGHSQGGMLAALLVARAAVERGSSADSPSPASAPSTDDTFPAVDGVVSTTTWAVVIGAAWPRPHGDLLTAATGRPAAPSLHIIGDADDMAPPEMAERVKACVGGVGIRHPGGHAVPRGIPEVSDWVATQLSPRQPCGAAAAAATQTVANPDSRGTIRPLQQILEPDRARLVPELAAAHAAQFGGRSATVRAEAYAGEPADPGVLPTTIVAVNAAGVTVGSIAVVPDDMGGLRPGMTPWIATLWVSPTHRRQGWATRLLKEALELAAAASPTGKIHLWTHTQALESNLYGPAGFVVIEQLDHRGAPAAIMAAPVVG